MSAFAYPNTYLLLTPYHKTKIKPQNIWDGITHVFNSRIPNLPLPMKRKLVLKIKT